MIEKALPNRHASRWGWFTEYKCKQVRRPWHRALCQFQQNIGIAAQFIFGCFLVPRPAAYAKHSEPYVSR
jgi:hypothetical protein